MLMRRMGGHQRAEPACSSESQGQGQGQGQGQVRVECGAEGIISVCAMEWTRVEAVAQCEGRRAAEREEEEKRGRQRGRRKGSREPR